MGAADWMELAGAALLIGGACAFVVLMGWVRIKTAVSAAVALAGAVLAGKGVELDPGPKPDAGGGPAEPTRQAADADAHVQDQTDAVDSQTDEQLQQALHDLVRDD